VYDTRKKDRNLFLYWVVKSIRLKSSRRSSIC